MVKDRHWVDTVVGDQIRRLLVSRMPTRDPDKFRRTLWFAYVRFWNKPFRHAIENMWRGVGLRPVWKSPVIDQAVTILSSPEVPKNGVDYVVKRFIENPDEYDNLIALAIVAQRVEVEIPREAYEKAVAKYGYLAQYLLTGEAPIREDYIRDNPETWIVVKQPKIKIVNKPVIQRKKRGRRRKTSKEKTDVKETEIATTNIGG